MPTKKLRDERLAAGLCGGCGINKLVDGHTVCQVCLDYQRSYGQKPERKAENIAALAKRSAKLKSEGKCPICAEPAKPGHVRCQSCLNDGAERALRLRKEIRDEAYSAYGGKCACHPCGETRWQFLTLDHVDGGGNQHRRELSGHKGGFDLCKWAKENGYPPVLQLLCMNCNGGRYRNGGICPHLQP